MYNKIELDNEIILQLIKNNIFYKHNHSNYSTITKKLF